MVQTLPPVPAIALSLSRYLGGHLPPIDHNHLRTYGCLSSQDKELFCQHAFSPALAFSTSSPPAPAGAVTLLFPPLLPARSRPSAPCLSLRCCCCWGHCTSRRSKLHNFPAVAASAAGRPDDVPALHRRARCSNPLTAAAFLADGAAGPVVAAAPQRVRPKYRAHLAAAVVWAAFICRCRCSNPLTAALPAGGATEAAAASATTASLQRPRHQRHADLSASAHVWLCWDREVAAEAKHSYSPFLSLFSPSLSPFSLISHALSLSSLALLFSNKTTLSSIFRTTLA